MVKNVLRAHSIPIVLLVLVLINSWSLFIPGLGFGHDINHAARVFEMAQGLREGVFPVIWSQNLAYGYGMPLFEFYAPLPYFLGAIFYLIGFNLTLAIKLLIFCSSVVMAVSAYQWTKYLFKDSRAALLSTAVLLFAPYRAVDLIRAAYSELWAIAFIPFVLLGISMIIDKKRWGGVCLSLSFAAVLVSHNITALLLSPFLLLYTLGYLLLQKRVLRKQVVSLLKLAGYGLLGIGISAFYSIPALIEKHFTQIDNFILDSYYNIHQHFLYIRQFIKPWGDWEYGGSGWGPNDEMSYFLGYPQLLILLVVLILTILAIKRRGKLYKLQVLGLILTMLSLLLTLLKTQGLWDLVPIAQYVQFPWRLLGIVVVFSSALAGTSYLLFKKKLRTKYFVLVLGLLLLCNTRYFRNEKYIDHSSEYQDYRSHILNESSNNLYDYLPKDLSFFHKVGFYLYRDHAFPKMAVPSQSVVQSLQETYQVSKVSEGTTQKTFTIEVGEAQNISLNLAAYPGWVVFIDGKQQKWFVDSMGLLSFSVPAGNHQVLVQLRDTPIRRMGKFISVLSALSVISLALISGKQKTFLKFFS